MVLFARLAPPGPMGPPEHYGKPVLGLTLTWAGDPAEGQRAATPIADHLRPLPYLHLQSLVDGGNQHGMHWSWRFRRVPELADDVIDVVYGLTDTITSPPPYVAGLVMGGTAGKVDPGPPPSAGAATGSSSASSPAGRRPTRRRPSHRLGAPGLAGPAPLEHRRLLPFHLRPDNVFRLNANIPPTARHAQALVR
jgi:hypothetical protein